MNIRTQIEKYVPSNEQENKEKGITLIAIVITVIILLILAGVAISMIGGENGLFTQANGAATKYNQAAKNEADLINQLLNGNYEQSSSLKATTLGIGGGGLLFNPSISPFDGNTMMVIPDMGGIYVSHNAGVDWKRKNLQGTVTKACFDPNREGVVYAGGIGLYRSTDKEHYQQGQLLVCAPLL